MREGKGNIILLTIIAVATLLVSVAGTTFAYFNAAMNGSDSPTTIEVTSGTLSVEYDGNATIHQTGNVAANQELGKKNFTITGLVTGSSNLNYEVKMNVKTNTYAEGELVYTITSKNVSNNGTIITTTSDPVVIPAGASAINLGKGNFAGPVASGAEHSYTISIQYVNGQEVEAAGKEFDATLSIGQATK